MRKCLNCRRRTTGRFPQPVGEAFFDARAGETRACKLCVRKVKRGSRVQKRAFRLLAAFFFLIALPPVPSKAQTKKEEVQLDMRAPAHPFPHYWEVMFGSGRANLSLRESYRRDLRAVEQATGFQYVRFHAIFHDENGVYDEDSSGQPVYNFSYVDQIYDGLLENHVRPFVELGFMPRKLAAHEIVHPFWYRPIVSPPKNWKLWDDLVAHFVQHLIDRYGIEEISRWYFEAWNEPNLDFWAGEPKEQTYYQLYDETAKTVKQIDKRLRVGGPATAQAAWVDRFIRHTADNHVPLDFVSTHVYANDTSQDVFGTQEPIPRTEMVCRAARKVHDQVRASARPNLPIIFSEYNASYKNEPEITDSEFMGPWLADTVRQCDGLVSILAYWTFSDVFEEQGVVKQPFYGGYGLIAEHELPKPAFRAFQLLHRLGDLRIPSDSQSSLATLRNDGSLVLALYNECLPGEAGEAKQFDITIRGLPGAHRARISRLDPAHGSLLPLYASMGKPANPTRIQIEELQHAAELPRPELATVQNGKLSLKIPPQGLALVEIR
jgi:xylan 1,4-beta-xylosidase